MSDRTLTIGGLARLTKTNPGVIRNYESLGLLPPPVRVDQNGKVNDAAHRVYDENDVRRLNFLRRCRDFGVLNPRLQLLSTLIDRPHLVAQEAKEFADVLLENVRDQANELVILEKTLKGLLRGDGEKALVAVDTPVTEAFSAKRLRRLIKKPLRTPK